MKLQKLLTVCPSTLYRPNYFPVDEKNNCCFKLFLSEHLTIIQPSDFISDTLSEGGYGINTQVEKSKKNDNRKLHGIRFK